MRRLTLFQRCFGRIPAWFFRVMSPKSEALEVLFQHSMRDDMKLHRWSFSAKAGSKTTHPQQSSLLPRSIPPDLLLPFNESQSMSLGINQHKSPRFYKLVELEHYTLITCRNIPPYMVISGGHCMTSGRNGQTSQLHQEANPREMSPNSLPFADILASVDEFLSLLRSVCALAHTFGVFNYIRALGNSV